MSVPGSNILSQALTALRCDVIQYFKATGRTLNDVGQWVTQFNPALQVYGSFQPVAKKLYEQYGLDLQKSYYIFYSLQRIIDVRRDVSNDRVTYKGEVFQCESNTGWFRQDDWDAVLCCRLDVPQVPINNFGFSSSSAPSGYVNFGNGNFYNTDYPS